MNTDSYETKPENKAYISRIDFLYLLTNLELLAFLILNYTLVLMALSWHKNNPLKAFT